MLGALKNTAERGLFAPLPHPQESRLITALSSLLPNRDFRLYSSDASLCGSLAAAGFPAAESFPDPALLPADAPGSTPNTEEGPPLPPPPAPVLWRPFLDAPPPDRFLIPVLPLPWPNALRVLALPTTQSAASPRAAPAFPPSELLSPVILAAATRCVYDLIAATPARGRVHYPRIEASLAKSAWERRRIYLHYKGVLDDGAYAGIFTHFLEQGFLLPPTQYQPLILPGILSQGEETELAGLLGF
jgi:hypothetical protein